MQKKSSEELHSGPNRKLLIHLYQPEQKTPKAVVIMAPAMAVPHAFYEAYCTWLSEQGFLVVGFDYYGIGDSQTESLRATHSSITEWATHDCQAVIDEVARRFPELKKFWFAHSIGGQIFGMINQHHAIDHVFTVATGTGYWRDMQPGLKYKSLFLWYGVVPWLLPVAGCFPGKRLGMIGDVPKLAMAQWRRWCLNPDYLVGAENLYERYAKVTTPITAFAFSDDEMLTQANIENLHGFYKNAPQQHHWITPAEMDVDGIGHFGVFRKHQQPLWQRLFLPELEQRVS